MDAPLAHREEDRSLSRPATVVLALLGLTALGVGIGMITAPERTVTANELLNPESAFSTTSLPSSDASDAEPSELDGEEDGTPNIATPNASDPFLAPHAVLFPPAQPATTSRFTSPAQNTGSGTEPRPTAPANPTPGDVVTTPRPPQDSTPGTTPAPTPSDPGTTEPSPTDPTTPTDATDPTPPSTSIPTPPSQTTSPPPVAGPTEPQDNPVTDESTPPDAT